MQRVSTFVITVVTILVLGTPALTQACGESLFRVGKGVAYRSYSAPIPANIVVYTETDAQREFAQQLAESGHDVRVTSSPVELASLLAADDYDVVVAPYSGWDTVSRNEFASAHYIPVVDEDSAAIAVPGEQFDQQLLLDGDLKTQLRTIHAKLVASS